MIICTLYWILRVVYEFKLAKDKVTMWPWKPPSLVEELALKKNCRVQTLRCNIAEFQFEVDY